MEDVSIGASDGVMITSLLQQMEEMELYICEQLEHANSNNNTSPAIGNSSNTSTNNNTYNNTQLPQSVLAGTGILSGGIPGGDGIITPGELITTADAQIDWSLLRQMILDTMNWVCTCVYMSVYIF